MIHPAFSFAQFVCNCFFVNLTTTLENSFTERNDNTWQKAVHSRLMLDTSIFTCFTHVPYILSRKTFDLIACHFLESVFTIRCQSKPFVCRCAQISLGLWIVNNHQLWCLSSTSDLGCQLEFYSTPACVLVWHQLDYEWTAVDCLVMSTNCTRTLPPPGPRFQVTQWPPGPTVSNQCNGAAFVTSRLWGWPTKVALLLSQFCTSRKAQLCTHRRKIDNCVRGWQVFRPVPSLPILTTPLHYNCWLWLLRWCIRPLRHLLHHCDRPITQVTNTLPHHCCLEAALPCSHFRFPPKPLWKTTWWSSWTAGLVC